MAIIQEQQVQPTADQVAAIEARMRSRQRKRKRNYTRNLTKEELAAMDALQRKGKRILVGVRPGFFKSSGTTGQGRTFSYGNHTENVNCELYLPDEDSRNSLQAVQCNVRALMDTTDGKETCALAIGILCCINPNFEKTLIPRIGKLGLNLTTIRIPSQAEEFGVSISDLSFLDSPSYLTIFGQTILFIFKTATDQNFSHFSTARLDALRAHAGVEKSTKIPDVYSLSKAQSVRSVLGCSRFVKQEILMTLLEMQSGDDNDHAVCRYLASILEYNEMSAVMFIYETLIMTSSIVLTDNRVLSEMMAVSEVLELMARFDLPQYFKYLAPADEAQRLERARFATLAAVAQQLKQDHLKQASVKNFVGAKSAVKDLAMALVEAHKTNLRKKTPITLDILAKTICRPAGSSVLTDDRNDITFNDDPEEEDDFQDD